MEINEHRQGAVTVVKPQGPLVGDDAVLFREKIFKVMQESLGRFILDASEVPFLDSQGLEALKATSDELGQIGQTLRISSANETLREVFDLTDLTAMFEHYTDVNSAIRSFL